MKKLTLLITTFSFCFSFNVKAQMPVLKTCSGDGCSGCGTSALFVGAILMSTGIAMAHVGEQKNNSDLTTSGIVCFIAGVPFGVMGYLLHMDAHEPRRYARLNDVSLRLNLSKDQKIVGVAYRF